MPLPAVYHFSSKEKSNYYKCKEELSCPSILFIFPTPCSPRLSPQCSSPPPPALAAGETTRVSVASNGGQANDSSGQSGSHVFSADGRFVAFVSGASNLVPGDTNGQSDIFVHDRLTKKTTRVSVASDGTQGNGYCLISAISADGRFVAFSSSSTNLVPGDTNDAMDAFVHDRVTHTTTRVSIASDGTQGNGYGIDRWLDISADGRFVAFFSYSDNLVPEDVNGSIPDVFVHDRLTGKTTLESVASDGTQGNYGADYPVISADGNVVAFDSWSDNLVPGDSNLGPDIFVRDRNAKKTTRVSVASDGTEGNGSYRNVLQYAGLSADGRFVSFSSYADNLVPGDTNNKPDVFVHDRVTHTTTRVSVTSDGAQGNGYSFASAISADGRFVAFESDNLIPGEGGGVFVHDRVTRETTLVSVASDGTPGNGSSFTLSLSADGRLVAFYSEATNLVPGDTNGAYDIFVRDRLLLPDQRADIAVTQTKWTGPVHKGGLLTYRVKVQNNGIDPASNVSLTDLVPLNARLLSVSPSQGSCYKGPISVCRLGNLAAGASATVQVNLKTNQRGVLKNTAYGNAPPKDPAPGNNTSSSITPVW